MTALNYNTKELLEKFNDPIYLHELKIIQSLLTYSANTNFYNESSDLKRTLFHIDNILFHNNEKKLSFGNLISETIFKSHQDSDEIIEAFNKSRKMQFDLINIFLSSDGKNDFQNFYNLVKESDSFHFIGQFIDNAVKKINEERFHSELLAKTYEEHQLNEITILENLKQSIYQQYAKEILEYLMNKPENKYKNNPLNKDLNSFFINDEIKNILLTTIENSIQINRRYIKNVELSDGFEENSESCYREISKLQKIKKSIDSLEDKKIVKKKHSFR